MTASPLVRGIEELAGRYGAIVVGLAIGTAAKYGLQLSDGKRLTLGGVVIDALLLGMLGLLAITVADWFDLRGNPRVMCGALAAVSSDRLIRLVRQKFISVAEAKLDQVTRAAIATDFSQVPAGKGVPDAVRVQIVHEDDGLHASSLRREYRAVPLKPVPGEIADELKKLDEHD